MGKERYFVSITCNRCGERYFLKGRERKGRIETGFRRCLCENENDFMFTTEKLPR